MNAELQYQLSKAYQQECQRKASLEAQLKAANTRKLSPVMVVVGRQLVKMGESLQGKMTEPVASTTIAYHVR